MHNTSTKILAVANPHKKDTSKSSSESIDGDTNSATASLVIHPVTANNEHNANDGIITRKIHLAWFDIPLWALY